MQLARPGFRQIGDFFGAIYSPYAAYGQDELNRYDTYYDDETVGASQQYRQVRIINYFLEINFTKLMFVWWFCVTLCHNKSIEKKWDNERWLESNWSLLQFTEASNLLSKIINGHDAGASNYGPENLADSVALNSASAPNSVPLIN